jgi:orotate phosphoribosyltransferase
VQRNYSIPVVPIATLDDLLGYLQGEAEMVQNLHATQSYRDRYGAQYG